MKRFHPIVPLVWLVLSSWSYAASLGFDGGSTHVQPAYSAPKGCLFLTTHSRAFFKDEVSTEETGVNTGETYWDLQGGMGLLYGFSSKLELGISQILYQDNHKSGRGYNFPHDLYVRAKLASLGAANSNLRFGMQLDLSLPTAEYHNLPLENYSAGRIGTGIMGLVSIVSKPLLPESGFMINANLGLFTHNDIGYKLIEDPQDSITVTNTTRELLYGVSVSKNMQEFGIFAELYGRIFLQQPPVNAYARESSLYFTPGLSYSPNPWLNLRVAMDLLVVGSTDKTSYNGNQGSYASVPWVTNLNLPSWRISLGAVIALNSSKTNRQIKQEQIRASKTSTSPETQKAYSELVDEQRKTEDAEAELDRIRSERQRMEDLLQRLRKILETPASAQQENPENK